MGVSPVNYRSKCVQNSTHSGDIAGVNKRLAVCYVPFLTKDCFCPSILTKLPLIDVQCCVYAREAALESTVFQCCHVLIFKSAFNHVVWSWIYTFLFWCYKTKHIRVLVFFCTCTCCLLFVLSTLTLYSTAHERS